MSKNIGIFVLLTLSSFVLAAESQRSIYVSPEEHFKVLVEKANAGDVMAQREVGYAYDKGVSVEINYPLARQWYQRAADNGSISALISLADLFMYGRGMDTDYNEAVKLLRIATRKGSAEAQNKLGHMYLRGWGVPKNEAIAYEIYKKAAAQGLDAAYISVGAFYYYGDRGIKQDFATAHQWYEKAAAKGFPGAFYLLGCIYGDGKLGPPDLVFAYALVNVAASSGGALQDEINLYRQKLQNRMTTQEIKRAQELSMLLDSRETFPTAFAKYSTVKQ